MSNKSYETTVTINAPVEKVYSYVADFTRHAEWNHQPQKITPLTSGETAVGSQYRTEEGAPSNMPFMQKMMMAFMMPLMKMKHKFEGYTLTEITDLVPNQRIAWTSHLPTAEGKKLMQMHWELRLKQENENTLLTQNCQIDPPSDSPLAPMITDKQFENNKAESNSNLKRLKSILDA